MSDLSKLTSQDIRETPLDKAAKEAVIRIAQLQRTNTELYQKVIGFAKVILTDRDLCRRFGIDYATCHGQERAYYAAVASEADNAKVLIK